MLPVYPTPTTRLWDAYTIDNEPITSYGLMERAACACFRTISGRFGHEHGFVICCGNGNNGGDGLVIARHLHQEGCRVIVCNVPCRATPTPENAYALNLLVSAGFSHFVTIDELTDLLASGMARLVVDAILGSGLQRPPEGEILRVIQVLNASRAKVIAIDMPSGMFADVQTTHEHIRADFTLSLQAPKLAQLVDPEGASCGQTEMIPIGLMEDFYKVHVPEDWYIGLTDIRALHRPRNGFSSKHQFGHLLCIGGSRGMAGAIILASRAAIRMGAGRCTIAGEQDSRFIVQTAVPEAMFVEVEGIEFSKYQSIALGPGLGISPFASGLVHRCIQDFRGPLVLDADALNCVAREKTTELLGKNCIITPHKAEFDRLFGAHSSDFERLDTAKRRAVELGCTIVFKSHHTAVVSARGTRYFNSSGNAGLAKGGTGDVLCGMIASLCSQGYESSEACRLAVFLHGHCADLLAENMALEGIGPLDLIDQLPVAFKGILAE